MTCAMPAFPPGSTAVSRPAQAAEWAGHSVAVLLRIYAKCIDGQDQLAKRRIEDALRESDDEPVADATALPLKTPPRRQRNLGTYRAQPVAVSREQP